MYSKTTHDLIHTHLICPSHQINYYKKADAN